MKLPQEILDKIFLNCCKENLVEWYMFVKQLRDDIYYIKYDSLEIASWHGSLCAVKYLIKKSSDSSKEMALIISSMMGNLNIVKLLIKEGAVISSDCIDLCEHDDVKNYLLKHII